MRRLARRYAPADLARAAYPLYEQFRPAVPAGKRGWGAKGVLDLDLIESPTDIVSLRIARAARDSSREERG